MSDQESREPRYRRYPGSRIGELRLPEAQGGPLREFELPLPVDTSVREADVCPPAIIDTDPEGQGLGVWVLVDSGIDEDGDEYCAYEYAGGIV
jgi:hypothetical protein